MTTLATAVLGLGSNLDDPLLQVSRAISEIKKASEIHLECVSQCYQTLPVGITEQPDFINAICIISTRLTSEALLTYALDLELRQGRVRKEKWGPRTLDVDILLYDKDVCNLPHLTLPHPELLNRSFWLIPLAEIAPDWILPNGQTVETYVKKFSAHSVRKI